VDTKAKIIAFLSRRQSAAGGELRTHLDLSRQAMSLHLRSLLAIGKRAPGRPEARYFGKPLTQPATLARTLATGGCDEDRLDEVETRLQLKRALRPHVLAIMRYAFTEMLNNAIEHSQSDRCAIRVTLGPSRSSFEI
jgi:DNA-binding transcriptional ArsR family regulator